METRPRPFVFVMMPFRPDFDDVFELGIRPACEAAGAFCQRLDQQTFSEAMLQRIFHQIAKADFLVADLSEPNPNVFYETGYAHALGKRVILLTQSAATIPFDLKHLLHVIYDRTRLAALRDELQQHVRWHIEHPERPTPTSLDTLRFAINGTDLQDEPLIRLGGAEYQVGVAVHNPTERLLAAEEIHVSLQFGHGTVIRSDERIETPAGQIAELGRVGTLSAGAWRNLGRLRLAIARDADGACALRLSTPFQLRTLPFRLQA